MTTTTKTRSRKLIEQAGGHCGMLPADDGLNISEIWLTCKDPARWVGVGKTLNTGECQAMVLSGELVKLRDDKLTAATIYKLAEVTA